MPQLILLIIQSALSGLAAIKGTTAADAALASAFVSIYQSAAAAFHQATGQPLDITKIPLETPVA